jgi:hypothetical protein
VNRAKRVAANDSGLPNSLEESNFAVKKDAIGAPIQTFGATMQRYLPLLGVASVLSLAFFSAALAAAVTRADLSGKKICWNNGSASSYGSGGKYSNNLSGEGTWSVTAGGVHIHTERYDYLANVQKLPDGTFHATVIGTDMKTTGAYCK